MVSHAQTSDGGPKGDISADVIIVGAGFGGCYALHRIRELGLTARVLEAGSDFGGVWHFNRYPGARVDSETPAYQLSSSKVWTHFDFTERYPGHEELREYFAHVDRALDLRKDTIFNARVEEVTYDKALGKWTLRTQGGLTATAKFVIFATGTTNKPYIPDFPGLSNYKGKLIHPAAWPEDVKTKGKKIGMIGQGASGLQILQELAKEDCDLTVFIRTPCTGLPMGQRAVPREESAVMKNMYDAIFSKAKYASSSAYPYNGNPTSYYDATEDERQALYEQLWSRGGLSIMVSSYYDTMRDKIANASLYDFWAKKVRSRITDPVKRDIVAPLEQFQWIGTKRPNLEVDYYEMLDRPNVKLVDLKKTPIKEFNENGILTEGQGTQELHDLDMVIVATGYDSVTGSLLDMGIRDKNGVSLQDKWKDGIRTYLGMVLPDTPNVFLLYGPQAPTSLANGPPFIEMQVDWIVDLLKKARTENVGSIEPSQEAVSTWGNKVWAACHATLFGECQAWWMAANIPGKRREPLLFFGGLQAWWASCVEALQDWSNFVISSR